MIICLWISCKYCRCIYNRKKCKSCETRICLKAFHLVSFYQLPQAKCYDYKRNNKKQELSCRPFSVMCTYIFSCLGQNLSHHRILTYTSNIRVQFKSNFRQDYINIQDPGKISPTRVLYIYVLLANPSGKIRIYKSNTLSS